MDVPAESRWARLPRGVRMAAGVGALLLPIGGIVAGISTMTVPGDPQPRIALAPADGSTQPAAGAGSTDRPAGGDAAGDASAGDTPAGATAGGLAPGDAAAGDAAGGDLAGGGLAVGGLAVGGGGLDSHSPGVDRAVDAGRGPGSGVTSQDPLKSNAVVRLPLRTTTGQTPPPVRVTTSPAGSTSEKPATASARPVTTTRIDLVTQAIPYATRIVHDPDLPAGVQRVLSPGATGQKVLRYAVTLVDGRPVTRRLVGSSVIRSPRSRVVAVGTRRAHRPRPDPGADAGRPMWIWPDDGDWDDSCDGICLTD